MRIAVLADVHANLPALEAVLDDLARFHVDGIIVAGDLIGGPQPNETIALLRSSARWIIRGNSDTNLLRYNDGAAPAAWATSLQFALLRWAHRNAAPESLAFLASLPEQRSVSIRGTAAIRVVHGSPRSPSESIYPDNDLAPLDEALSQIAEQVMICGHTHEPWARERNGKLGLNPGAVCGPLNGYVGAQYALLTWSGQRWHVEHRAVPYNLDAIRTAFRGRGLLDEGGTLARSFLLSIETGRDVALRFLTYAYGLTAMAGFSDAEGIPDAIWEEATATFDWDAAARAIPLAGAP